MTAALRLWRFLTEYLKLSFTGQLPRGPVTLLPDDLSDYPPQPIPRIDWCLIASWMTVSLSMFYFAGLYWNKFAEQLIGMIHRLSGGRFGHTPTLNVQSGPILGWMPGQMSSVQ